LPTKIAAARECSKMRCTLVRVSVGYTGTDRCPAIQIARSATIHHAVFFDARATCEPSGSPKDLR
jgi:hypothetical protein